MINFAQKCPTEVWGQIFDFCQDVAPLRRVELRDSYEECFVLLQKLALVHSVFNRVKEDYLIYKLNIDFNITDQTSNQYSYFYCGYKTLHNFVFGKFPNIRETPLRTAIIQGKACQIVPLLPELSLTPTPVIPPNPVQSLYQRLAKTKKKPLEETQPFTLAHLFTYNVEEYTIAKYKRDGKLFNDLLEKVIVRIDDRAIFAKGGLLRQSALEHAVSCSNYKAVEIIVEKSSREALVNSTDLKKLLHDAAQVGKFSLFEKVYSLLSDEQKQEVRVEGVCTRFNCNNDCSLICKSSKSHGAAILRSPLSLRP